MSSTDSSTESVNSCNEPSLEDLPKELIERIFTFFLIHPSDWGNLILTCKRWQIIGSIVFDPGYDDNYPIRRACAQGYSDVVLRFLQDHRVDPSANDDEAIKEASRNGHLEVVKILMRDSRGTNFITTTKRH